jgi:hypothetical protein
VEQAQGFCQKELVRLILVPSPPQPLRFSEKGVAPQDITGEQHPQGDGAVCLGSLGPRGRWGHWEQRGTRDCGRCPIASNTINSPEIICVVDDCRAVVRFFCFAHLLVRGGVGRSSKTETAAPVLIVTESLFLGHAGLRLPVDSARTRESSCGVPGGRVAAMVGSSLVALLLLKPSLALGALLSVTGTQVISFEQRTPMTTLYTCTVHVPLLRVHARRLPGLPSYWEPGSTALCKGRSQAGRKHSSSLPFIYVSPLSCL